uniref:Uncharacterized protein n=1 Tax=Anguilla anguilla TaxID=7936 RepID=A0A0E9VKH1_ANGAN
MYYQNLMLHAFRILEGTGLIFDWRLCLTSP